MEKGMKIIIALILFALPAMAYQPFKKGQTVTCIYNGVHSWSDGDQFMKPIPLTCTIKKASPVWKDVEPKGHQQMQIDCSTSVDAHTGPPGVGLVKNHPLNAKIRWVTSYDCYHFSQ